MRSIWKGSISFGLVNVPVKVYSATQDHDIKFHQVHAKDNGRIRYKRVCEVDGEVVEYRDIARAYESDDGQMVIITDDDIATLPEERSREIEVLEFVPASELDPMMYDKSYFLEPDGKSTKSYVLLAKTLADTDRVAIVHFALRNKTRLAALRVKDFSKREVMVIHTLLWPDEIRDPDFPVLDKKVEVKPAELKMAGQVVESMADDFNPTLMETDRVAIVHFALRNKTRLAALRVQDFSKRDVMVIQTLLWPDEIRDPDFPVLDKKVEVKPAELKMAEQVVESMTDDFHPDQFRDDYQEQLYELVQEEG